MMDLLIDAGMLLSLTAFYLYYFVIIPRLKKRKQQKDEIDWNDLMELIEETQLRWGVANRWRKIFFEVSMSGRCKVWEQSANGQVPVPVVDVYGKDAKDAVARAVKVCNHYYTAQELIKEKN